MIPVKGSQSSSRAYHDFIRNSISSFSLHISANDRTCWNILGAYDWEHIQFRENNSKSHGVRVAQDSKCTYSDPVYKNANNIQVTYIYIYTL